MPDRTPLTGLQFFDPKQEHTIAWKNLPHWAQAGTVCFITWRTADSLPKEAIGRLNGRRQELLRSMQLDPNGDWKASLAKLPAAVRAQLHWSFFTAWDAELDNAAGACVLRERELSEIVMNSLLHFDNDRYVLADAVVMPNHVHLLVAFRDADALMSQCQSWKRFTATGINRRLREQANVGEEGKENLRHGMTELRGAGLCGASVPRPRLHPPTRGEFWQVEQFDHLVRSPEEFEKYRRYIADNPRNARLSEGGYRSFAKAVLG